MTLADVLPILNGGGVLALALIVWLELRAQRVSFELVRTALGEMTSALSELTTELRVAAEAQRVRDDLTPTHPFRGIDRRRYPPKGQGT